MKKLIGFMLAALVAGLFFSGCYTTTGQYLYDKIEDNKVALYKVVKKGVVMIMTKEEIQEKHLDKVADAIEYLYSVDKESGEITTDEESGKIVE